MCSQKPQTCDIIPSTLPALMAAATPLRFPESSYGVPVNPLSQAEKEQSPKGKGPGQSMEQVGGPAGFPAEQLTQHSSWPLTGRRSAPGELSSSPHCWQPRTWGGTERGQLMDEAGQLLRKQKKALVTYPRDHT